MMKYSFFKMKSETKNTCSPRHNYAEEIPSKQTDNEYLK